MPNPHASPKTLGSRAERRKLQSEIRKVTAGFLAFLALSLGLVWFYATHGIDGLLSVNSGRFGHGVSNGVGFVSLPFAAAIFIGWDLIRLRRRLRDLYKPEQARAPAPDHTEA